MTATDELRKLLDERGVEWRAYHHDNRTWWSDDNNVGWFAEGRPAVTGSYVKIEAVMTPEQAIAATLGCGTLTAEQVREAIKANSWAETSSLLEFNDSSWQAIADELNATPGRGTCEIETTENWLPAERYHRCKHCGAFFAVLDASGDIPPCVCPNCGKRVKRREQ